LSEAFLISTALSATASDSYSISSFASQSRLVAVFNVCMVYLQSFDITPLKSFLSIIIIIMAALCRRLAIYLGSFRRQKTVVEIIIADLHCLSNGGHRVGLRVCV